MSDPYLAPESRTPDVRVGPPWHERLLIGVIFLFYAFPFVFWLVTGAIRMLTALRGQGLLLAVVPPQALLAGMFMSLVMFLAGLMLVLRRRSAVAMFAATAVCIVVSAIAYGEWDRSRTIWVASTLACMGYAAWLRKRGRMR